MNDEKPKARRLKTIAAWINENRPELRATIEKWKYFGDGKIAGTRLSRGVKGKEGNRIKIYHLYSVPSARGKIPDVSKSTGGARPIFDHNSAETYRSNDEVERWLAKYLDECVKGKHRGMFPSSPCEVCGVPIPRKTK